MTATLKRDGRVVTSVFDALNRQTERTVPGTFAADGASTATHKFAYDKTGRMVSGLHAYVMQVYAYDKAGRLLTKGHRLSAPFAGEPTVSYAYDAAGNVAGLTHPDGYRLSFTYDALNRVTEAYDDNGPNGGSSPAAFATLTYDPLSRRKALVYANGTRSDYDYTARGDLTDHDWDLPGGPATPEMAWHYVYNGQTGLGPRLTGSSCRRPSPIRSCTGPRRPQGS